MSKTFSMVAVHRPSRPPCTILVVEAHHFAGGYAPWGAVSVHFQADVRMDREPRFRVEGVYSEFGVPFTDLPAMQEYRHIIEKCKAGKVDLVMIHDLCLAKILLARLCHF